MAAVSTESPSVILVTGGSGLVGHGIRAAIEQAGDKRRWVWLSSKEGDLRDWCATNAIFARYQPTHVIHLAARVGGLFANMRAKLDFFRDNMLINDNVLRACHEHHVEKCISCLSTCIFPDKTTFPINESMLHE